MATALRPINFGTTARGYIDPNTGKAVLSGGAVPAVASPMTPSGPPPPIVSVVNPLAGGTFGPYGYYPQTPFSPSVPNIPAPFVPGVIGIPGTNTGNTWPTPGPTTPSGSNPLSPGGGVAPTTGISDPYGTLVNAGCNLIPNPVLRAACIAAGGLIGQRSGGTSAGSAAMPNACPAGYEWDAAQQKCVTTGIGRYLPGDVGTPDVAWTPTYGYYGVGVAPAVVARQQRVCPPGFVVGKDGVCYRGLARGNRAHNPGAKPFLTGGEVTAIRTANRLEKKFKRLSRGKGALFNLKPACGCAPQKGKKR